MTRSEWSLPVDGGLIGGVRSEGDGPDLLFVPNVGASAMTWSTVLGHLEGLNTVALDLRGHARSVTAPLLTSEETWRDIVATIEGLDLRRPVVVGHTTGGFLALAAAADRPDLISAVVTIEAALLDAPRSVVHAYLQQVYLPEVIQTIAQRFDLGRIYRTQDEVDAAVATHQNSAARDWILNEVPDDIGEEIRYSIVDRGDGTWLRTPELTAMMAAHTLQIDATYYPSADLYRQVPLPIHVVQVEDGLSVIPPHQEAQLQAELSHLTFHHLGGGHLAHRSHADELAIIIARASAAAHRIVRS